MNAIVIVGGGPVGLTLAAELRLAGAEVVVLERNTGPSGESRALGVHARTLEVFDQRGVADRFPGRTIPHYGYAGGLTDVRFAPFDTPFGLRLIPQSRTEAAIGAWAEELGADVRRGHEVTALVEDEDGVEVEVEGPDGGYRLRTPYLVGCDGGHSRVRRLAGFDFPGTVPTVEFLMADVADVPADAPFLREIPFVRRNEVGHFMVLPVVPDAWRLIVYEFDRKPSGLTEAPEYREVCEAVERIAGIDVSGATPRWTTRLGNASRQVDHYRRGRVLLAGDAAHVHMPAAGQGLNLGVQDAVNLGWKLAAEVAGRAPEGLLDSYHAERAPVGDRVLTDTQAQFALLADGPEYDALRRIFAELMVYPEANRHIAGLVSGLDIRYDLGEGHPLLGRRLASYPLTVAGAETTTVALLHGARGVLLDLGAGLGGVGADWADRVDTVVGRTPAPALEGVTGLLVRPDGHIAWLTGATGADVDADGLRTALGRWFGAPGRAAG